ncbi:MAG: AAA family ATPase [Rikenellaceae bacterium]
MLSDHITSQIYRNFVFTPTFGQKKIIESFAQYISIDDYSSIFIINGYAGTGKTSLVGAITNAIKSLSINTILMAPTGRAAKVMSGYCNKKAFTIHRKIYRQKSLADYQSKFTLNVNKDKDTVYIVDEASMISGQSIDSVFGSGNLLDDLISYVRSGTRCRLVILGDSAQLPPVGQDSSPALNPYEFDLFGGAMTFTLDEVVRQEASSGILFNATLVRCMIEAGIIDIPMFELAPYNDIERINGGELIEKIQDAYDTYGLDQTIVITRSNKRANRFNEGIRRMVLFAEEEIGSSDMLMIVKNNYFYPERLDDFPLDFIANGDIARLRRIRRFRELYGFRFAQATLEFPDYDNIELDCNIILDTLSSESPSLTSEQNSKLFFSIAEDYPELTTKAKKYRAVRENEFFNAMQVKFSYAVTCHKAQGGQWRCVFIDQMLFGDSQMSLDLLRWLYTALTRATDKVYLVNFDDRFFAK